MGEHQVSRCASHRTHVNSTVFSIFYRSAISHDPELFDSPQLFEPERFLGERGKHPRLADFDLPFGFGRRICPGRAIAEQALFIVISRCVADFSASFLSLSCSHTNQYAGALMCSTACSGRSISRPPVTKRASRSGRTRKPPRATLRGVLRCSRARSSRAAKRSPL